MASDLTFPNYEYMESICSKANEPFSISGVHGFMSASLAVDSSTSLTSCIANYGDGEISSEFLEANNSFGKDLQKLYLVTLHNLSDTEFNYQLFLPDEDASLSERLQEVSCWCADFLLGFAYMQKDNKKIDSYTKELLSNYADFSQVDWKNENASTNELEMNYQEIIEFIRLGVIAIHTEYHKQK